MSAIARTTSPLPAAPDPTLRLTIEPPQPSAPPSPTSDAPDADTHSYHPLPPLDPDAPRPPRPTPIPRSALNFNPPEAVAAQIIQDLCRPDSSLADIAQRASTTIEAITLWMSRPDISARLDAFEASTARHIRMAITNTMQATIGGLGRIITEFHESQSDLGSDISPATPTTIALASCRNRTTFIDASKLLLRIHANYAPRASPRRGMGLPAHVSSAPPEVTARQPTPPRNNKDLSTPRASSGQSPDRQWPGASEALRAPPPESRVPSL